MSDLRIVRNLGDYGPNLKGIMDAPGKIPSTLGVWEADSSEVLTDFLRPNHAETDRHRLMRFNLEIVNLGNEAFSVGNIFQEPDRYLFLIGGPRWYFFVKGFYTAKIKDGDTVLAEAAGNTLFTSDAVPAIPGMPRGNFGFLEAGLSPAWAMSNAGLEYVSGQYVDITDLPDGDFDFEITIDPNNWAGQTKTEVFQIGKRGFDVRPPELSQPL